MDQFQRKRDVIYGELGYASYDPHVKQWNFTRTPGRRNVLRWMSGGVERLSKGINPSLLQANKPTERELKSNQNKPEKLRLRSVKSLSSKHPDFVGYYEEIFGSDLIVSSAVEGALNFYDATAGDLIGFNTILLGVRQQSKKVYAYPSGPLGKTLQLAETASRETIISLNPDEEAQLSIRLPHLTGNVVDWKAPASAIRQICFPVGKGTKTNQFLAVRFAKSTTIFQIGNDESKFTFTSINTTDLSLRRYLELKFDKQVSFSEHVDVTFNPWWRRQIAVIDQAGRWIVIEISNKSAVPYNASFTKSNSGLIKSDVSTDDSEATTPGDNNCNEDGWGRIRWVLDVNTILVSTRTKLRLISLKNNKSLDINLARGSEPYWIYDIRSCQSQTNQFFVLTSRHIWWIEIVEDVEEWHEKEDERGYKILLISNHFRHGIDLTTKLKIVESKDIEDIKALVYSRFSPVISCFRLTRSTDQVISATCTDPTRLSIPAAIQSKYKLNIGILDMDVRSVWSSISQNEGPTDDLPTEIFEFNILLTDMSLWKPLAYTEYDKNTSVIKVLKAGKVRHRRSSSVRSKSFIVEDAPPSPLNLKITIPTKVAQDDKTQKLASTMMMMPFYEHLLDLRFFVTSSFYDRLKVQMEGKQHEVNPKDRFETLKTMAQKGVSLEQTLKTGLELCDEPFDVLKLHDAFDFFDNLRMSLSDPTSLYKDTTQALLPSLSFESLRTTFEMLTSTFGYTLTTRVRKAYRVRRAYILRSIATELFLAQIRIPRDFIPHQRAITPDILDQAEFTLPIHPSSPEQSNNKGKQRALPEEPQTIDQSPQDMPEDKPAPAITKWVYFSKPVQPIFENVQRQLAHWQVGDDPGDYNFLELAILDRDEQAMMELDKGVRVQREKDAKRQKLQQGQQNRILEQISQIATSANALHIGDQLTALESQAAGRSQLGLKAALRKASQAQTQKAVPRNVSQTQTQNWMETQTQTQTQVQSEVLSPTRLPKQSNTPALSQAKPALKDKPPLKKKKKKKKKVKGFG